MPDYEGGNVFLQVVPSFDKVQKRIGAEARRWGSEAGDEYRKAFDREAGKPSRVQPGPAVARSRKSGSEAGGAYADGFRRKLEAATRSLPPVRIGVAKDAAEQEIKEIGAALAFLSDQTIGVDLDAATAMAQVEQLQARLERLGAESPDVQVRADAASALAALATVAAAADSLDAKDVEVDVRVRDAGTLNSFTGRVVALGTAIAALGPALVPLGGVAVAGLAGIGTASVASAAGIGVLAAGFNGIGDAVGAMGDAQRAASEDAITAANQQVSAAASIASAQRQVANAERGLTEARASAADAAVDSAERIEDAQQGVVRAERDAADAAEAVADARRAVADASQDAARGVEQALARQEDAERSLADAQRVTQRAQEDLTQARADAREEVEDLALSVRSAALSEEDAELGLIRARDALREANSEAGSVVGDLDFDIESATLDLQRARERMAETQVDPEASQLDVSFAASGVAEAQRRLAALEDQRSTAASAATLDAQEADLAVRQASLRLDEARERNIDVQAEAEAARDAGIEGSDEVLAAQERVAAARRGEEDAARRVTDAEEAVTQARIDGAERVAQAQEGVTDALERSVTAQEGVADAQDAVADAFRDQERQQRQSANAILGATASLEGAQASLAAATRETGDVGSAAMQKLQESMDALAPAGVAFATFIYSLRDEWGLLQDAIQGGLLPGVQEGIEALLPSLPAIMGFVGALATAMGDLAAKAGAALAGPAWAAFFGYLNDTAPGTITTLGSSFGDLALGLANLMTAFAPLTEDFLTWLADVSSRFAEWSAQLGDDQGFQGFIAYIQENSGAVSEFFGSLVDFFVTLVQEMAPFGPIVLEILTGIMDFISGLPPGVVSAIVLGIIGLVAVFGLLAPVINFVSGIMLAVSKGATVMGAVIAALGGPVTVVIAVIALLGAALVAAYQHSETFRNIVDAAVRGVALAFELYWNYYLKPILTAFGDLLTWLWRNVAVPAFEGISAAVRWAWENAIKPAMSALVDFFQNTVAPAAMWLWRNVIKPAFEGIGFVVQVAWNFIKLQLDIMIHFFRNVLAPVFTWLWQNVVKPVFEGIGSAIKWAWDKVIKPVFSALGDFIRDHVAPAFRTGVDAIGSAWDRIMEMARKPVNFVIDTVYNNGIRAAFNKVAEAVGSDAKLPAMGLVGAAPAPGRGAARGVVARARGGWTRPGMVLVGEEGPELVDFSTPGRVYTASQTRQMQPTGPYGGPLDEARDQVRSVASGALSMLTDPFEWVRRQVAQAMGEIPGAGMFGDIVKAIPGKMLDLLKEKLGGFFMADSGQEFTGVTGGWGRPGNGRVTSEFGMRRNPVSGIYKLHNGIDLAAGMGSPIRAARGGSVVQAGRAGGYGNFVQLSHGNGEKTGYAHLSSILTKVGAIVAAGQQIGREGSTGNSTGPHLHFNYSKNGGWINPRSLPIKYDSGGYLPPGMHQVLNATGKPEAFLDPQQTRFIGDLAQQAKRGALAAGGGFPESLALYIEGERFDARVVRVSDAGARHSQRMYQGA